jgi:chromosome segregation ATPase
MDYHVKIRILEENLLEKDKKLEQSLKHCLKLKMELAELRLNDQNNSKRINELIIERDKAINYVNIYIKTLHEFENKLKNNIEDKNCIINKLETDLKECNKLSNLKYNELKDNNEKLKSQIQKINESLFITQIRNKFLDIVLQQKDQIEAENKSIKEQLKECKLKLTELDSKIQENKFELEEKNNKINLSQDEINKLVEKNASIISDFNSLKTETDTKLNELDQQIKFLEQENSTLKTSLGEKINQIENLISEMNTCLESNLVTVNKRVASFNEKKCIMSNSNNEPNLSGFLNKINKLEMDKEQKQSEINTLQSSVNNLEQNIVSLNELDRENSQLKVSLDEKINENENLLNKTICLAQINTDLGLNLTEKIKINTLLSNKLEEANKKIKLNDETLSAYREKIKNLEMEKEEIQNEINELKSSINDLKQQLDKSNEEYKLLNSDISQIIEITNKRKIRKSSSCNM